MKRKAKKAEKATKPAQKKKKGSASTVILVVIMLIGLSVMLYPTVSDWWNSYHQSRAIASYVEAVRDMSAEEREAAMKAAEEYNARLATKGIGFTLSPEEEAEYSTLLDISGTGIMGYIQIPKINVNLPIYHGVDEAVLQIAVGHISGTSLPIGGESTHSVLSGHRGLPSAKLFTDLDQLMEGDIFTITVLEQTVTYQVDQIRIVLPEDTSELALVPGGDYSTLITCTPYGVNSHRMLVRGTRIDNLAPEIVINAEAAKIPVYVVVPAVGIPMMFVMLVLLLLFSHNDRKRKRKLKELYRKNGSGLDE